jgi:NAD(P)-dependent dehydrogenase (short-subunit alcohol dehydrogenase family)
LRGWRFSDFDVLRYGRATMSELSGKVCLVTGGAGGIGSAITEVLAAGGARVVLHHHANEKAAAALAARFGEERVARVKADLSKRLGAAELWRAAVAVWGRVDVLVNNAAIMPAAPLDADWDDWHRAWDETLRVNLVAAADLSREAVKHFGASGGGVLVNVASRAAFRGDTLEYMAYAASKAGLVALTRSIARGAARQNVLAYVVAPGFVDTPMAKQFVDRYGAEAVVRDIPLGTMAPPGDVARVVAFLASGVAPHATGTTIDINGASYVR